MEFIKKVELYDERDIANTATATVIYYAVPPKSRIIINTIVNLGNRDLAFANGNWTILIDGKPSYPFGVFSYPIGASWSNGLLLAPIELKGGQTFAIMAQNTHAANTYNFLTRVGFDLITEK